MTRRSTFPVLSAATLLVAPLLVALLLLPGCARAQQIDMSRGGPVEVTSSRGMEWRQNEQIIIAEGDARAVRGTVTVTADRLIARYRRKAGSPAAAPATPQAQVLGQGSTDTGNNEVYRLEAEGNVHIFTATDQAVGDRAVYDIDQSVLVLTGKALRLTTPTQVMTARDVMEYWSQKHMAVGRGDAVVTTSDGRRIQGDTLVGFTSEGASPPASPGAAAPAAPPTPKPVATDPLAASGKLQRVEGFGHVEVRTAVETIRGERGVYVADTGIARLAGNVHITRGQNQLNGDEAVVNMKTGISTLNRAPAGRRVEGLIIPNDTTSRDQGTPGSVPTTAPAPAPVRPGARR